MPLEASLWYILIAFYCGTCEDFAAFPVLLSDFARYEITVILLQRRYSPKPEISWRFQESAAFRHTFLFELKHGWRALFL